MTTRCGCELPFRPTVDPYQCACGRWHVAVVFHDYEQGTSWTGWDLAPGTEAAT